MVKTSVKTLTRSAYSIVWDQEFNSGEDFFSNSQIDTQTPIIHANTPSRACLCIREYLCVCIHPRLFIKETQTSNEYFVSERCRNNNSKAVMKNASSECKLFLTSDTKRTISNSVLFYFFIYFVKSHSIVFYSIRPTNARFMLNSCSN